MFFMPVSDSNIFSSPDDPLYSTALTYGQETEQQETFLQASVYLNFSHFGTSTG